MTHHSQRVRRQCGVRCDVIYHPPDFLSYSQYLKTWEVDSPGGGSGGRGVGGNLREKFVETGLKGAEELCGWMAWTS